MRKITKKILELESEWTKAWGGRILHCFLGEETLCGKKNLTPHSNPFLYGYPDKTCEKCEKIFDEIMGTESAE
jgi:hypothetical protein